MILKGSSYILNECFECGLTYQKQIPNDLLMKKIYNEWIIPKLSLNRRIHNCELILK